ncbi:MAG: hypothetical protein ACOX1N_05755 [Candidatus Methanomethylophilaceae archaeon]
MKKSNIILITTIAVVAALMVPPVFGLSTVFISENKVELKPEIAGGVGIDENTDPKYSLVTTTEGDYPAVSVQSGGSDNLLNGGVNSAEFDLEIPSGVNFIILGTVKREFSGPSAELKIDVLINGVNYVADIKIIVGTLESVFYYTASGLEEGNKTLRTIPKTATLSDGDFMRCDDGPVALHVEAGRGMGLILRPTIEFKIVLLL